MRSSYGMFMRVTRAEAPDRVRVRTRVGKSSSARGGADDLVLFGQH